MMNITTMIKEIGRFVTEGPIEHFVSGEQVTLRKHHTITRDDLDPPRTYIAKSDVSFILTDDPEQFDKIPALELIEPEPLMSGPKPGETWRHKGQYSRDMYYNFACVARDYEQTKWFVWHDSGIGEAFVISKNDNNWEKVS